MIATHYFAGGNTAQGFYSCFEDILPVRERKRMYYIKGGPGVGKSTLMRRVGEAAEQAGLKVEYFHCSSDPDSLDGVCLPQRGVAMMDGTAPHVYDPVVPGARDTLLSLGDFLDEAALVPHAKEIENVQGRISACFARCYHYLGAAKSVLLAAARGHENPQRAHALAAEWAERMPLRGGQGSIKQLFASAYTPKGRISVLDAPQGEQCISIECPFGLYATELMHALSRHAAARGLHAVELLNPLSPGEVDGVLIPKHGLHFLAAPNGQGACTEAARVFDLEVVGEKELGFDKNAYELLIQRALEQLTGAKALHDELERFYVGSMDFMLWEGVLQRVLQDLEL